MFKDSLNLVVVSHLWFLIEKWNENESFRSGMWQPLLGVLTYQTFDKKIKSTHPTKIPLSAIQLFTVSFYFYSSIQCGDNEILLARWDISTRFLSSALFSEVHFLFNFKEQEYFQASFEGRPYYLKHNRQ